MLAMQTKKFLTALTGRWRYYQPYILYTWSKKMKDAISHHILKSYLIYCIPVYFLVERLFANLELQAFEVIHLCQVFPTTVLGLCTSIIVHFKGEGTPRKQTTATQPQFPRTIISLSWTHVTEWSSANWGNGNTVSSISAAQADNSFRKLWLRCGCQFPWCALGLGGTSGKNRWLPHQEANIGQWGGCNVIRNQIPRFQQFRSGASLVTIFIFIFPVQ
jgi:hypothetical protein